MAETKQPKDWHHTVSISRATKRQRETLRRGGLPGYLYQAKPYTLEDTVRRFDIHRDDGPVKSMTKRDQIEHCESVFAAPKPFVACASSEPNDLRAKQLAAYAMLRWLEKGLNPKWHTIIGGLPDTLRDAAVGQEGRRKPDALILANADLESTAIKREKLRDLLEMYSNVPRLITTTGADPVAFMNRIGFHCHHVVWVRSTQIWEM